MAWETYAQIAVVLGTSLTIVLVLRNSLKDVRSEGMLSSQIPGLIAQEVSASAEQIAQSKRRAEG